MFSTIVSAADLWLTFLGPKWLHEALIPYVGWCPGNTYMFCALGAWQMLASPDHRQVTRLWLVGCLLIGCVVGYSTYSNRGEDFGNPYLRVSRWQPIWTMAIPAAWACLLLLWSGPDQIASQPRPRPTTTNGDSCELSLKPDALPR